MHTHIQRKHILGRLWKIQIFWYTKKQHKRFTTLLETSCIAALLFMNNMNPYGRRGNSWTEAGLESLNLIVKYFHEFFGGRH